MTFEITEGIEKGPWKLILYGDPGIGKTTLASKAPRALIVDIEDGSSKLNCKRIRVTEYGQLREAVTFASRQDIDTVIFDSASAIEGMMIDEICRVNRWRDLSAPGFGKGQAAVHQHWRDFLKCLHYFKARGKNMILIAHARTKTFENAQGENYDRIEPELQRNCMTHVMSEFDTVLYLHTKVTIKSLDRGDKTAIASGHQILTVNKVSAVAKNRFLMPEYISIPNLALKPEEYEEQVRKFWNLFY